MCSRFGASQAQGRRAEATWGSSAEGAEWRKKRAFIGKQEMGDEKWGTAQCLRSAEALLAFAARAGTADVVPFLRAVGSRTEGN